MKRQSVQTPWGHPALWSTWAGALRQRVMAIGEPQAVVDGVEEVMRGVFLVSFPQGDAATVSGRSELELQRALVAQQTKIICTLFDNASALALAQLRTRHHEALCAAATPAATQEAPRTRWWKKP